MCVFRANCQIFTLCVVAAETWHTHTAHTFARNINLCFTLVFWDVMCKRHRCDKWIPFREEEKLCVTHTSHGELDGTSNDLLAAEKKLPIHCWRCAHAHVGIHQIFIRNNFFWSDCRPLPLSARLLHKVASDNRFLSHLFIDCVVGSHASNRSQDSRRKLKYTIPDGDFRFSRFSNNFTQSKTVWRARSEIEHWWTWTVNKCHFIHRRSRCWRPHYIYWTSHNEPTHSPSSQN